MGDLLRFWFTFERSVDRGVYLRHGVALMALKYGVDATAVGIATGTFWSPLHYLQSVSRLASLWSGDAPAYLATILALWTLPFLWIGTTMTIRRLLDAGWSAWWSLLFFVPLVSYLLFAILSAAPSVPRRASDADTTPEGKRLPSALLSMAAGAGVGLGLLIVGVLWIESYGLAVFMGTPFVLGLVTGYFLRSRYPASARETHEVVAMTTLLVASTAFLIGFEGLICLLMVAPLGLVIALMGGAVGRHLAALGEGPVRGAVLIAVLLPGSQAIESGPQPSHLREVVSSVEIDASAETVWNQVLAFSPIPEPRSLLFRLGLAYPTHAEIRGSGVGAVRYCYFSTGPFVEPITVWEPGVRLSFDVADSPRPLEELTPWDVAPPHLDGYLVSRRGEFRLVELGEGRTRLEGSTWYEQRLKPEGYWVLFSDFVIGRIHRRVLDHIKGESEVAVATLAGGAP